MLVHPLKGLDATDELAVDLVEIDQSACHHCHCCGNEGKVAA